MEGKQPKQRVVVCGGGIIGVCTAFFLSKKGAAVTLVEKSSVACAASGKAAGFLALDWLDNGPLSELARASFNLHRSLASELDGAQSYAYRPLHTLGLSVTEAEQSSTSTTTSPNSIVPSWVDGPFQNPCTIGTTDTTAQVHPQLFTRKLVSSAVSNHGLELVIGELNHVEVEDGRVVSIVLKEGGQDRNRSRVIETDRVVLALGPWSSRLPLLSSLFKVSALKVHSLVLQPRQPNLFTSNAVLVLSYSSHANCFKPIHAEVHPRSTGEVYLSGMIAEGESEVPDDPEQIVGDPESIKMLKRVAETVSSHLREGEAIVKAEQACYLPCTENDVPVIGEVPNVKGCYVATGHSYWGILNAPGTGAALAELIMDGTASIIDLTPFSPARFV